MRDGAILIVEDDPALVHAISRNLNARGFDTRSVASVADAIDEMAKVPPALILLDIELPDGSGWEVARVARAEGRDDVPIIVISALRPNPRLVAEVQAAAVLEKPFPIESVLRLVEEYSGRRTAVVADLQET